MSLYTKQVQLIYQSVFKIALPIDFSQPIPLPYSKGTALCPLRNHRLFEFPQRLPSGSIFHCSPGFETNSFSLTSFILIPVIFGSHEFRFLANPLTMFWLGIFSPCLFFPLSKQCLTMQSTVLESYVDQAALELTEIPTPLPWPLNAGIKGVWNHSWLSSLVLIPIIASILNHSPSLIREWVYWLHICLCIQWVLGTHGGQKRGQISRNWNYR